MRIKELVHTKHRHRLQQFVKTNAGSHKKAAQKTARRSSPVIIEQLIVTGPPNGQLPLFMECVFKAKDFDPL